MNSPPWTPKDDGDTCRVLIVEDDADSARALAIFVQRAGHEVETTRNGTEALAVAASYKPHIVLVDIGLPGLDGLYVVRELRKTDRDLLIVATTGRSGPEEVRSGREACCDHHLLKPIDLTALAVILDQWKARNGCGA